VPRFSSVIDVARAFAEQKPYCRSGRQRWRLQVCPSNARHLVHQKALYAPEIALFAAR